MADGMQRQRHGTTKKLVEGVGGLIVGAALVILIGNLLEKDPQTKKQAETETTKGELESQT